jgi:hypothetical protein
MNVAHTHSHTHTHSNYMLHFGVFFWCMTISYAAFALLVYNYLTRYVSCVCVCVCVFAL